MTPEATIDVFRQAIYLTTIVVLVLVMPGLVVGLIVAMFQAATQINEMSLSFVPRLIVTFLAAMLTGPWILKMIKDFTHTLILEIPMLIG